MQLYEIHLPAFEGPLDLLLRLIEREELDVTTVALARVTDQYLERLAQLKDRRAGDLADFLLVAAKLVLIKSLALLPASPDRTSGEEAGEVAHDLVNRLQIYKRFKEVASLLQAREERGLHTFIRLVPPPRRSPVPSLGDVSLQDLVSLAFDAMDLASGPAVDSVVAPITVTIEEQIEYIEQELTKTSEIGFRVLLSRAPTRLEIIVTLLAVLELVKHDRVSVQQDHPFGEIVIRKVSAPRQQWLDGETHPAG